MKTKLEQFPGKTMILNGIQFEIETFRVHFS